MLRELVVVIFALAAVAYAGVTGIVHTVEGPIRGLTSDGVQQFRGIPFAAPPVGELRFRPPQPHASWTSTRDCYLPAMICPQVKAAIVLGGEDCLYLDVYVPENPSGKPLPVMFWIFGGGYTIGDGYEFGFYDGKNLAKKHGVIVVTPNYRLGAFGFLALREFLDLDGTTGNYGVQDQRSALQWVQRNIKAFGGDPSQVTIFGESAGAFSVCYHLASEASAGLFHAAIMESGTCDSPYFFVNFNDAETFSLDYTAYVGCNRSTIPSAAQFVACLHGLSSAHVMTGILSWFDGGWPLPGPGYKPPIAPVMPFGLTIDGSVQGLKDLPLNLIKSGKYNKVPTIAGTNKNEGSIFVPMMPLVIHVLLPLNNATLTKAMMHFFNNNATIVSEILTEYPANLFTSSDHRAAMILRDYFFVCSSRRALRAMDAQGAPTWMYHFTYKGDWVEDPWLGDYHSAELEFVWDNPWPPIVHRFSDNDTAMAASFGQYWTNLAKFLDPSGDLQGQVAWPPFTPVNNEYMQMDVPTAVLDDVC
eukprot:TRINITY_DN1356_c0_g1_i2.p1 TRINITY_DN1356_c0_g1~~TRINITY_DN1356_c0_g1_i2.p1  ORF type:complete len:530 (+),score=81.31 TRINITY_DN1356_c0_g1_i2:28-1617(+)